MKDKTKKRIKTALAELLGAEPFESLTVTKVCENAGITRASFYKYFKNTADVLQDIKNDFFAGIDLKKEPRQIQLDILRAIREHRNVVYAFFTTTNPVFVDNEKESRALATVFYKQVSALASNEEETRFLFEYSKVAVDAVIFNWVKNGCKESDDRITDYIFSRFMPNATQKEDGSEKG